MLDLVEGGDQARTLSKKQFAERVGAHLVKHPDGLRQVMIQTLEAARHDTDAQLAIVDAMEQRRQIAAKYLVARPKQLANVSEAIVEQAIANPDTKDTIKEVVKELID